MHTAITSPEFDRMILKHHINGNLESLLGIVALNLDHNGPHPLRELPDDARENRIVLDDFLHLSGHFLDEVFSNIDTIFCGHTLSFPSVRRSHFGSFFSIIAMMVS